MLAFYHNSETATIPLSGKIKNPLEGGKRAAFGVWLAKG
jgi:hypothetical protein